MASSSIEWTGATWNPVLGCSRVSEGCRNCYAERQAARCGAMGQDRYQGLTTGFGSKARWTGAVRFVPEVLDHPLRWKKPRRIFVNSMSDLFHEAVDHEWLLRIFDAMAACPQHTFQVLTKRPERARDFLTFMNGAESDAGPTYPLPNVHLGVSVEDQATADARIPVLLATPSAVRWVSYEPALGPVRFDQVRVVTPANRHTNVSAMYGGEGVPHLDWIVVGGESGPDARPFDLAWARSTVEQCRAANVPVFVKQLGAWPVERRGFGPNPARVILRDRKGGEMIEWPEDLRIREFAA